MLQVTMKTIGGAIGSATFSVTNGERILYQAPLRQLKADEVISIDASTASGRLRLQVDSQARQGYCELKEVTMKPAR
jgi:hypothetical protein